jgi:membrane protein implicated in regulation of membrane protease activity
MPAWLIWLIIAGALAVSELTNLAFVLIMAAVGALAGSLAAGLGAPLAVQILVAVVVTLALMFVVRPPLIRKLHPEPAAPSGADRLVGQEAIVLFPVTWQDGRVRLNGAEWSARTSDRNVVLPVGAVVDVVAIDGATAVVQWQPDFRKDLA